MDFEILDGVTFEAKPPSGEESTSDAVSGNSGELVPVGVDIEDALLSISINPFEVLDDIPALRALDVLTEDFGPKEFTFLDTTYEAGFEYTLFAPSIAGGYGLVQSFEFDPDNIAANINIGDQSFSGLLGDSFDFTAPDDLEDSLTGSIEYLLRGNVDVSYALAPIGSIGFEALSASGTVGEKDGRSIQAEIGPLFSGGVSGSTEFGRIDLFDPITFELPDDFFAPIVQEFEIPLIGNTIGFDDNDFIVETLRSTGTVFTLDRTGNTSFPIRLDIDGEITQNSEAIFNDFSVTLPAGENPTLRIPNNVSSLQDDVAYEITISIPDSDPASELVTVVDDDASVLLIGDQVDDRGGQVFSDPHFITFDNISYDFQAAGDFILARATEGAEYEVQVRFTALSSAVSVTKAMATSVDDQSISIEANGTSGGILLVDGEPTTLDNGQSVAIGQGFISRSGSNYQIDHGNGDSTSVRVSSTFLNVGPEPSLERPLGTMEGLLGDANGIPDNEFQLADGTELEIPVLSDVLYGEYGTSWLVDPDESLLPGTPEPYAPPGRIITVDSLPDSLRRTAEAAVIEAGITNPQLRDAATLDFALTGNREFIEATLATQEDFSPLISIEAIDPVIDPVIILTSNRTQLDEESASSRSATLTVARGLMDGDLTVNYSIEGIGENPASSEDFQDGMISGSVVIEDGSDSATFDIVVANDSLAEETETFDVNITIDDAQADNYEVLVSSVRISIDSADEEVGVPVTANNDSGENFITDEDTPFITGNVLNNDTGDGKLNVIALNTNATQGTVVDNGDGTFDYDPNGSFDDLNSGEQAIDTFSYTVENDNDDTDTATVEITITGLDDDDDISPIGATEGDDVLIGTQIDETIDALGGNDLVAGGLGDDEIFGGNGDDILRGDLNRRSPRGGAAGGDDIIRGGKGNDRIGGKAGNDQLFGDEGDDQLFGDDGDDLLYGGLGDDMLTGDDSSNGKGSDTFVLAAGEGLDTITDFKAGIDFIGLSGGLSFGSLTFQEDSGDTLVQFESNTLAKVMGVSELIESNFITV